MTPITLPNLLKELKGQTFVKAVNLVFAQCSSATLQDAQVYQSGKQLHVKNKMATANMELSVSAIAEMMVTRVDLGDGLIIDGLFIILL